MKKNYMGKWSNYFYDQLVNITIPFWITHATDKQYGGFTTFLDRTGALLSPDKPMWVMGRISWVFSKLYNDLEKRAEWLTLAQHGIDFIRKYGFDTDGRVFFAVTRDGKPLRKRRYLFAETFVVIALAEYAKASGGKEDLSLAKKTMSLVRKLYNTPGSLEPKIIPATLTTRGHSMAMIQINTLQVLRRADSEGNLDGRSYNSLIDDSINEVFKFFVKPEKKVLLETVGDKGEYLAYLPEGRCMNPGHAIETAWFILEEGRYRHDNELVKKALPLLDWSLDLGWDKKYGGLFYFVDVEGKQPVQLEWDMKLWWPHLEAMYATLLSYYLTGDKKYARWFGKITDWSVKRFPDKKYGEWFGYLHRDGSLALDLKGNYFKGPFHLPRQQLYSHLLLQEMLQKA
ncbi:MAG: AGE family epimerase/isomerase [Spirochaetota bacterium]